MQTPSRVTASDLTIDPNRRANGNGSTPLGTIGRGDQAAFLEDMYEQWRSHPETVEPTWSAFFEGFELGCQVPPKKSSAPRTSAAASVPLSGDGSQRLQQARIYNLLFAYRMLGHYIANLDPLGFNKTEMPELGLENFKLSEADLDQVFDAGTFAGGGEKTLREIITALRETYCGNIGVEFMHIQNSTMRRWVRDRAEGTRNKPSFKSDKKRRILNHLMEAEQFERFLHTRYVGQKRFSLEGGETLIPMLDALVEACPKHGVQQVVMGMAHRGRLNVLANVLGKDYKFLFSEFADNYIPKTVQGDGDVKYHLGFEASRVTSTGEKVGISLAPNPSHLEAVNPVVEGKARAWQRMLNDTADRHKVMPVLIHGDAAFAGQGVVMETLNLSQLNGYKTGGTVHIVINNQIGFTTLPEDGRSMFYCTGVAKMLDIPVYHVNGDDPVSAVFALEMAFEFRQRFHKDVVIDVYCYRRNGHNEGDEPSFTQPTMYSEIDVHPHISDILLKQLVASGDIVEAEAAAYKKKFEEKLNDALTEAKAAVKDITPAIRPPLKTPEMLDPVETAVNPDVIKRVGYAITNEPADFQLNAKIKQLLQNRRNMVDGKAPLDWSTAEALAFGTLLDGGMPIRLSGQDSRRGTFSQRHSVLYDARTRERYIPLKNIATEQASFCVYNSPLSEGAVLGFDFGYSLDYPNMLTLWEAQFGDFVNGAQTIIDQYITSSESKWGVTSGIVLLLPHGYHGQGPEHSSARLERFLQACAEDNIQVTNCTTPASYYHLLRRQALRKIRKPLVIMTPKGLLRDKRCVSPVEDLSTGRFEEVLPDTAGITKAKRVILCSGKVYYDLADYRTKEKITDVAILRVEQMYPLHEAKLKQLTEAVASKDAKIVWCQEESHNMGAWSFMEPRLRAVFKADIVYAGRDASASPSTGALSIHELEQRDVVHQAFTN